jgi:hypothetical protein
VLGHFSRGIAVQHLEPEVEAELFVRGHEFRRIADAADRDTADSNRVVDDVRENRTFAG